MGAEINSPRRQYAVLGTGAIGGYYGACLQRAGYPVHFLLHRDYDHVQAHGLKVDSIREDFILPKVKGYPTVAAMPPVDVVLIALKTTHNARLLPDLLPPLIGEKTVVVTLQNGLGIESEIAKRLPQVPILGGLCFICSNKMGPGHIRHLDYGDITLGAYDPQSHPAGISSMLQAIAQDFTTAGITIDLTADLYLSRWRKLVWNIPFNGLSVVLNATTTAMMANPDTRQLVADLMAEVVAAANGCVQRLPPPSPAAGDPPSVRGLNLQVIDTMLENTAKMKPYRTSMKIDYDKKRPLETEAIVGVPLRAAQAAGVDIPRIEMLYRQLKMLEAQRL